MRQFQEHSIFETHLIVNWGSHEKVYSRFKRLLLWKNWIDSLSFLTRVSKINLSGMSGFSFSSSQRAQGKWGIHMIIANQSNLHLNTSFTRAPWRGLLRYSDAHSLLLPASNIAPPPPQVRPGKGRLQLLQRLQCFNLRYQGLTWALSAEAGAKRQSLSRWSLTLQRKQELLRAIVQRRKMGTPSIFSAQTHTDG